MKAQTREKAGLSLFLFWKCLVLTADPPAGRAHAPLKDGALSMSDIDEKNNSKNFPPIDPFGTIIRRDKETAKRKMKTMNYKMVTKDFLAEVKANKTRSTFYSFQSGLNRYGRYLDAEGMGDADCEYALSMPALNAYKYKLVASGLLGQSTKGAFCSIKSLCTYLILTKAMAAEENPFLMMTMPGNKTPVRLLVSDEEVMSLMEAAERQYDPRKVAFSRLLVSTLVHTGGRAQEVVDIQMDHIHIDRETLEFRYGKGDKSRTVNPPREWWIALRAWLPIRDRIGCEHSYLFASGRRSHISDERLRAMLEELKAIGGMKGRENIKPHSLRHWFASHLHTNGGTIPMIQAALGHATLATTWKYIHSQAHETEPMKQLASFAPPGWGATADVEPKAVRSTATPPAPQSKGDGRSVRYTRTRQGLPAQGPRTPMR